MSRRSNALRRAAVEGLEPRTLLSSGRLIENIGRWDNAQDLAVQPDGKIVLLGYVDDTPFSTNFTGLKGHYFLARYLPDGTPDPSFGHHGKVVSAFEDLDLRNPGHLALAPDGSILVGGHAGRDGAVVRHRPDGSLDTTFGDGGKVVFDVFNDSSDMVVGVVGLADGSVVVAASASKFYPFGGPGGDVGRGEDFFAVRRFTPAGRPDPSFGQAGQVLTKFLVAPTSGTGTPAEPIPTSGHASALAVAPDGKITLGGTVNSAMALPATTPTAPPTPASARRASATRPTSNRVFTPR